MDRISKAVRSKIMTSVGVKNTGPERYVRRLLRSNDIRFRGHPKNLPGTPDLFLDKSKTAIFVNGCFWHGHANCRYGRLPKSNRKFWHDKIARNVVRDRYNVGRLRRRGYRVFVVWECAIKRAISRKTALLGGIVERLKGSRLEKRLA